MKRILFLFLPVIISFNFNLFGNNSTNNLQLPDYPSYKVAITEFLKKYSIEEISYPEKFYFAKKPDGWHALIVNIIEEELIKDELFWNRKTRSYLDVDFPEIEFDFLNEKNQNIIDDKTNNYLTRSTPYWGYAGWDKDVIVEYENKQDLSDTLLNALARAYCSYASNLLSNNTGFSSKETRFNIPKGQNALTKKQLAEYRKYENNSIRTYYKLWKTNPDFEAYMADAYNIYSNEILNSYLTILYHQNREEARKQLKDGLYDSFFINMAKKYLASCDSNAILFVYGDIGTYPLLYVQEMEGFRTDVTVINYTLLVIGRYINHLFDNEFVNNPVDCKLNKGIYKDDLKQYFYINKRLNSVNIDSLIAFVESENRDTKILLNSGDYYDYIPSRDITFNYYPDSIPGFRKIYTTVSEDDTIFNIKLKRTALYLNNFCFLDIFCTNGFKRPVYFATSVPMDNYLDFEDYFQCEGLAYKIMPIKQVQDNYYLPGHINTEIQYNKLMNLLTFSDADNNAKYYDAHKNLITNYRIIYGRLIDKLIEENKKDSALIVLNSFNASYPPEKIPHDYFSIPLIESYYKLDKTEYANKLVLDLFNTSIKKIELLNAEEKEVRLASETVRVLMDITNKYVKDSDINKKVINEYNQIFNKF